MARENQRSAWMGGLRVCALVSMLSACGGSPEELASEEARTAGTSLSEAGATREMVIYSPRGRVDESTLVPLDVPPEAMGGLVLEGTPQAFVRMDHGERGMSAGIFKATTGVVRIHFPFTEHATILEGEVTITDESGRSHTFRRGESYLIRQGQTVLWEVKGKYVIKSFFNVVQ